MSINIETMQKCLFCYRSSHFQQKENNITLPQIIASCNKHLTKEIVTDINWKSVHSSTRIFCQECYNTVEKLVALSDQLDRILKDIKELDANLISRISKQRRNNEQSTSTFYNVGDVNSGYCDNNNTFSEIITTTADSRSRLKAHTPEIYDNFHQNEEHLPEYNHISGAVDNYSADVEVRAEFYNDSNGSNNEDANSIHKDSGESRDEAKKRKSLDSKADSTAPKPKFVVLSSELRRHLANKDVPGYECEKCHKRFSRLTFLHRHDCSKSTVECKVCNISFSATGVLKLHMRSHTGEKPFKCETCGKCFTIKQHLETHMRIHTGERPFKCEMCEKSFREKAIYNRHVATHETRERLFPCDTCSKSFFSLKGLKSHLLSHTDKPHKCVTCGKGYISMARLRSHQKVVNNHSGENPFKCEICEKGFPNKHSLNVHVSRHGAKFLCEECGKYFSTSEYLAIHMLTHTEEGPFICETCGKKYPSSVRLKSHIRYYHSERAIKCGTCGKPFKCQTELLKHENALECEGPPFKCVQCDQSFNFKIERERHTILQHVVETERPTFTCNECPEIFHLPQELSTHVRIIHRGLSGVSCEICKRQFKNKTRLQSHKEKVITQCKHCPLQLSSKCEYHSHRLKNHSQNLKEKKLKQSFCPICNLQFVNRIYCRTHIRSCHPKEALNTKTKDIAKSSQSSHSRAGLTRKCTLKGTKPANNLFSSKEDESDERGDGFEEIYGGYADSDDELEIKQEEELSIADSDIKTENYYD